MRVHWEKLGILGPVYRLVGRGFSNDEIASQLNITQENARRCVVWLMRLGGHSSRAELVLEAFATIPLDGHGIAPVTRKFDSVPVDICQGESQRQVIMIQPGTMLIREGFILPDSAEIKTAGYSITWRVMSEMDNSSLDRRLSLIGLHLFNVAGELKVVQVGSGAEAVRRGLKKMLDLSCRQYLNCTEITQITPRRFLGVPYVVILAHSFHIQKGTALQSSAERRSEQTQRDWACG
jgi:hypothetical protein